MLLQDDFVLRNWKTSQPSDVCPVPGGTSHPPHPRTSPSCSLPVPPWSDSSGLSDQREQNLKGIPPVPLSQSFSILAMHRNNLGAVLKIPVPRPLSRPDKSDSGGWGRGCAGKSLITGFLEENTHVYICTEIYYKFY